MSLFLTKEKKPKSSVMMTCFLIGLFFCFIYGIFYSVLIDSLYRHIQLEGDILSSILHSILVSVFGTAVCCIFFILSDKRVVTGAFTFLFVFLMVAYIMIFSLDAEHQSMMAYFISIYGVCPVLIGNIVSRTIYYKHYKKKEDKPNRPIC